MSKYKIITKNNIIGFLAIFLLLVFGLLSVAIADQPSSNKHLELATDTLVENTPVIKQLKAERDAEIAKINAEYDEDLKPLQDESDLAIAVLKAANKDFDWDNLKVVSFQ